MVEVSYSHCIILVVAAACLQCGEESRQHGLRGAVGVVLLSQEGYPGLVPERQSSSET